MGLLLLVFLLLQVPAVQQKVARQIEHAANASLNGGEIGIGTLDIDFFSEVEMENIYLNNPAGDTIGRVGAFSLTIDMLQLLQRNISVSDLSLSNVRIDIRTTDSTSNIAFLTATPPDTVTTTSPSATDTTSRPWELSANSATLLLEEADIYFQDDKAGVLADVEATRLKGEVNSLDLTSQLYDFNYLELTGTIAKMRISDPQEKTVPEQPAQAIKLIGNRVTIKSSEYDLDVAGLAVKSKLPYVNLEGGVLELGQEVRFNGALLQLEDIALQYDTEASPQPGPGIDYNHISLSSLQAEATDIAYLVDSLHLRLRHLAANEKSGFSLENTTGAITYSPSFVGLANFELRTSNTRLSSTQTAIAYDFSGGNLDQLRTDLALKGQLGLKDVALLAPDLAATPLLRNNYGKQVSLDVLAQGTAAAMNIPRLQIFGPGIRILADGQVKNISTIKNIGGRLNLTEFSLTPGPILPLIPATLLPEGIDWPQKVIARGTATYQDDRLTVDLYAVENRSQGDTLRSAIRTSGSFAGLTAYPDSQVGLSIDTIRATKQTILAYLPANLLPPEYELPAYIRGSGRIDGPLDDLQVDVQLSLPGAQTYAKLEGNITNVLQPEKLNIDLEVSDLALSIDDVRRILPEDALPANLNLPDLRIDGGTIAGSPEDLKLDVPLISDNGTWRISGRYRPDDTDLEVKVNGVDPAQLFTGALRDTLEGLELGELNIEANIKGAVAPSPDLDLTARIGNDAYGKFLSVDAEITKNYYAANFRASHPELIATGKGAYEIEPDSSVLLNATANVSRANLQYWEITQEPMVVAGNLDTDVDGLDPYALDGYLRLDSIVLLGATGSSYVDTLLVEARLDDLDNEVTVTSEVLEATLLGRFDPVNTPVKMLQFIQGYWDTSIRQPNPVENGESLDFTLNLKRPQPFTGGLVNGLWELSPFQASLLYRDATPELLINLDLPKVNYAGLEATNLTFRTIGDVEHITAEADWEDVSYNNQIELGRTVLQAESIDEELLVELKLYSDEDSLRHYLGLIVDSEADTLLLQLEPEQILNFETWTAPVANRIAISGDTLLIDDLTLRNNEQLLAAATPEPNDVVITLKDYDIQTLSRLFVTEEETAGGIVNGTVGLDNALSNLGVRSDLIVKNFSFGGTLLGDVQADITSRDEQTYAVDVSLVSKQNNARLAGTVELNGPLDLVLNVPQLQLTSAEPFSLGYLNDSEGYLSGKVAVGGTINAPDLDGNLQFNDASIVISLLGGRFRLDEQPIQFSNSTVSFGDNWRIYDAVGGSAQVQGEVEVQSLTYIPLDLNVEANNLMAINSTEKDNKDWYGKMFVNANVDISGTATRPIVDVTATTSKKSAVTYVYRVPQQGQVAIEDIVDYSQQYLWDNLLRQDTLQRDSSSFASSTGIDLTLELAVAPNLEATVIVDPVSGQTFVGRATGDLTLQIYPDGRQEATGRVELVEGEYDFIYQNIINRTFRVLPGSSATFTGDIENPTLDLKIRHQAEAAPLPLVQGVLGEGAESTGLRRAQTFFVDVNLKGELLSSSITTNVVYPEDAYGNLGLSPVEDALATLRQDQSRMTTTAFQLLAFGGFNIPLLDAGAGNNNLAATTLNNLMGNYLNTFADQLVGFVDLDFGLDSYQDEGGQTQTNLRISLRKTLFDDRVIISVDGVAGTAEDELAGTQQTYLDNITAEYLISEDGTFRLKFFNDRDRSTLVGDNVIRFGGRLTFGKDFDRIRWFGGAKGNK